MMRQTGGSAVAATSTRSRPFPRASWTASRVFMMPSCSPSSAITRTCGTRILSLMRVAGARRLSGRPPRPRNDGILTPPQVRVWSPESGVWSQKRKLSRALSLTPDSGLQTPDLFVRQGARPHEAQRRLLELRERHRTDVAARAFAHGDLALFHLAVAADEHERNLLQLRVAYLRADLVAACVQLHSKARLPKLARDAFGVLVHAVSYRQHRDLNGREPKGKRARVVFDEHAEEAFDRAEESAVNHDGPV